MRAPQYVAYFFSNTEGTMIMVFDESGQQVPDAQGRPERFMEWVRTFIRIKDGERNGN
jgi:hypothetical protein